MKVSLCWFRDSATKHIGQMYGFVQILAAHDISVEVLLERRPGYIVYEDEFQIVAEPFAETRI